MPLQTMSSIEKITSYDDGYDLYRMEVLYDYDLDRIIDRGIKDDKTMIDAILKEIDPSLSIDVDIPSFGCTVFRMGDCGNGTMMGRNYDFKYDSSAMLVHCKPKDGYESVGFAGLNNVSANHPLDPKEKPVALTSPFICLDGINEKGVSIAILTLDSKPTNQNTGKKKIFTTLAVRLVLDRAATTAEAVEILEQYDMMATNGRDYHFCICDPSGDCRVVEYDCDDSLKTVVTPVDAVTNFFIIHMDKVLPNQKNGLYGHGKERYDAAMRVIESDKGRYNEASAWKALIDSSQDPNPDDPTSNTQWSIVYNNMDLTAHIAIRRHWDDKFEYDLHTNKINAMDS